MTSDKNAEIWSTRLQKELLALTTDNATEQETKEVAGILPPFIRVKAHELDIAEGICKVWFVLDLPPAESDETGDIVIVIDASLARKADGSIDPTAGAYPFLKPLAIMDEGAERFPPGSTVQNGSGVDIDCDWTPSLHLTDAILNVGLKVKESLLQKEPFHANEVHGKSDFDEILQSARRFGSFLGKSAKSLIVEKPPARPKRATPPVKKATATDINIGDEINFLEAPWVDCQGLYSCKAIRRPAFVEDAMFLAAQKKEDIKPQVSSPVIVDPDDGDVPEDFGNFVKMQTGVMSKVCFRVNDDVLRVPMCQ